MYINKISSLAKVLKECGRRKDLEGGKQVHFKLLPAGLLWNEHLLSSLIHMYSRCGRMVDAHNLFYSIFEPDVVAWNVLLHGYVENGESRLALKLLQTMTEEVQADARTYVVALTAVANLASQEPSSRDEWLARGMELHSEAVKAGWCNIFVETVLIHMYGRFCSMFHAREVFDKMVKRNTVSWTALLHAYVDNGESLRALEMFECMRRSESVPNARTFAVVLSACSRLAVMEEEEGDRMKWMKKGEEIHSEAVARDCCDVFVESSLVDLYGKCKRMVHARNVFDRMQRRNVVAWNALLQGYLDNGESETVLAMFDRIGSFGGVSADARTYVTVLMACGALAAQREAEKQAWLEKGKALHAKAVLSNCCDEFVENTCVDMYSKCGSMPEARSVFDNISNRNVIAWTALLQGYVDNGEEETALKLFSQRCCAPNERTFVVALGACGALAAKALQKHEKRRWLLRGKMIHSEIELYTRCDNIFVRNKLILMYSHCGDLFNARNIFDSIASPNLVSWNSLIQGYVDNGESKRALEIFSRLDTKNSATFLAAVVACGEVQTLEHGVRIHAEIKACGLEHDPLLVTALIDMYGKCGDMEAAKQVFESNTTSQTVHAWNALMCGYSQQGDVKRVLDHYESMLERDVSPSEITFTHLLTACSHAGLADTAREHFDTMERKYGLVPNLIHYNCMVDVLSRGNCLEEALRMVRSMRVEANVVTWTTVLNAAWKWKNASAGKVAYEALLELKDSEENDNAVAYVLMANVCENLVPI